MYCCCLANWFATPQEVPKRTAYRYDRVYKIVKVTMRVFACKVDQIMWTGILKRLLWVYVERSYQRFNPCVWSFELNDAKTNLTKIVKWWQNKRIKRLRIQVYCNILSRPRKTWSDHLLLGSIFTLIHYRTSSSNLITNNNRINGRDTGCTSNYGRCHGTK